MSDDEFLENRQYRGILSANGNNRYTEIIRDEKLIAYGAFSGETGAGLMEVGNCKLTKDGQTSRITKDGKTDYSEFYQAPYKTSTGTPKTAMEAYMSKVGAIDFDDAGMNLLLGAILPDSEKIATVDMPKYQFVGSGWLDNGLNYEDYAAEQDRHFSAIRYYFDGYTLVKIAAASYYANGEGEFENYQKYIVRITEFSPTPDAKYLSLPEKFVDKVKKDKKGDED